MMTKISYIDTYTKAMGLGGSTITEVKFMLNSLYKFDTTNVAQEPFPMLTELSGIWAWAKVRGVRFRVELVPAQGSTSVIPARVVFAASVAGSSFSYGQVDAMCTPTNTPLVAWKWLKGGQTGDITVLKKYINLPQLAGYKEYLTDRDWDNPLPPAGQPVNQLWGHLHIIAPTSTNVSLSYYVRISATLYVEFYRTQIELS